MVTNNTSLGSFYNYVHQQASTSQITLKEKAKDVTQGDMDLAKELDALSMVEFSALAGSSNEVELKLNDQEVDVEVSPSILDKVKSAIKDFKDGVKLAADEIKAVKSFVSTLKEGDSSKKAVIGVTEDEYEKTKNSSVLKYETGTTDKGVEYAILTGVKLDFLENIRDEATKGRKKPKLSHIEDKIKELEGRKNLSQSDTEKLVGYKYIRDNWSEFTKSGGKKKLSKSNLKQLEKLAGKDGFITLEDLDVSKGMKGNYHRKKVWGTVAAAVVGTAVTVLTGGALGPIAAGAIGAAAGSVTSGVIEGKKFKEIAKDAAIAAALGAVGGIAAKGAGSLANNLTGSMKSEAAKAAVKAATVGAARGATTSTLNDLVDDGKLNNLKNIGTQTLLGGVTGAAASGISSATGEFGQTFAGKSLERGAQQAMQRAANDALDGDGKFDWTGVAAEFAGGTVTGAFEQGLSGLSNNLISNPDDKLWVSGLTGGVTGFVAGAAGELVEGAIEGEIDELELLASASANMQSNAIDYEKMNKIYQKRLANGQQHWMDKAIKSVGNGVADAAQWVYQNGIQPAINGVVDAGKWVYNNAILPVAHGIESAYNWTRESVSNLFNGQLPPVSPDPALFLSHEEMMALMEQGRPQTELISTRPELQDIPELMSDKERAAGLENYNKTKYDNMKFSDAFAEAMRDAQQSGQYMLSPNGKPAFMWQGQWYALEYAPVYTAPNGSSGSGSAGNTSEYDFAAGGNASQNSAGALVDASGQLLSGFGSGTGLVSSTNKWTFEGIDSTTMTKSWVGKAAQTSSIINGGINVYNGAVDFYNGNYVQGAGELAKGVVDVGGKYLAKKLPGVGVVAGIGDGVARWEQDDYFGATLSVLSGAATTIPGIGTGISMGIDGVQLLYDGARWWLSE